ncbi:TIGR04282 family arsenosugar biosynthesis glycosyltransferase [Paractinoplanes durhamensis]|uniref:Glycosyltransferase n=1 Tax=Paractinoplanes durhamensis TaxID=113563 RepID=A0ABQ3ZAZ2_9ACTN|nr:TIGR04282 family arsenosugar biosynthesis glycosyltransferase [Actinoplanes durhamensis]GIE06951.1 hypothetical protein Adu01nite_83010 [Actinoplanes durhamensis]
MNAGLRVVVLAKVPVPGRVKTRLCPPCTPEQAARVAAAALADTIDAVSACGADVRVLVTDTAVAAPPGWEGQLQRGGPLGERLAGAFADTRVAGTATLLVGMDTPQLTAGQLDAALAQLASPDGPDAVLGPAEDGGWWGLGLREPAHAVVLRDIPTSTATTGSRTREALRRRGLRVGELPGLRDVDTADDAYAVAGLCPPGRRFPRAVAAEVSR